MSGGRRKAKTQADSVKSVSKVFEILEYLAAARKAVSVSQIARETGVNVTTAFRLLQSMIGGGYVVQEEHSKAYLLGPRFLQLAGAYLDGNDLASLARPHLDALRDELGETAYLVIYSQGEIVQLCKSDGKQTVSASIRPMVREPAYCTATGKVLLSGLPSDELEKYFDGVEIKAFTPHTVTSRAALTKEMKRVAADGYALDNEEFVPNLCCLSVPVRSENNGAYIAAVSVAIPKMRFDPKTVPALAVQLQQKAKLIAQQLRMIEG